LGSAAWNAHSNGSSSIRMCFGSASRPCAGTIRRTGRIRFRADAQARRRERGRAHGELWNFAAAELIGTSFTNDRDLTFMPYGAMQKIRDGYNWRPCYVQSSRC
jgi:hypothetical protein